MGLNGCPRVLSRRRDRRKLSTKKQRFVELQNIESSARSRSDRPRMARLHLLFFVTGRKTPGYVIVRLYCSPFLPNPLPSPIRQSQTGASPSVQELVCSVRAGDEQAATALLNALFPLVLKIVRSHLPARGSEDDLCQMIFVRIFRSIHQYSAEAPFEHWVSRVAINVCLNQIERQRIRPELRYADLSERNSMSSSASLRRQRRSRRRRADLLGTWWQSFCSSLIPGTVSLSPCCIWKSGASPKSVLLLGGAPL